MQNKKRKGRAKRPSRSSRNSKNNDSRKKDRRKGGGDRRDAPIPITSCVETAVVDKNQKGFGFLIFDHTKIDDQFLPPHRAKRFFSGDRVAVSISKYGSIDEIKVIEHQYKEIIGRFEREERNSGWVYFEKKRIFEKIWISRADPKIENDDWVKVKIIFAPTQPFFRGEILKTYGKSIPASMDLELIASEFNLREDHDPETVQDAKSFTQAPIYSCNQLMESSQ